MIKRSFFGLVKPRLQYEIIGEAQAEPVSIKASKQIRLYLDQPLENTGDALIKTGDQVKSGQKIALSDKAADYLLSSKSGRVSKISSFAGIMGKKFTSVTIDVDGPGTGDGFELFCRGERSASGSSPFPRSLRCRRMRWRQCRTRCVRPRPVSAPAR